jgi:predicted DNA-binding protein
MLPVRLTPESHERLRRWSADHGFAMAVVVRGLIERFLEERAA